MPESLVFSISLDLYNLFDTSATFSFYGLTIK